MIDRPCATCGHSINVHVIDSKTRKRGGCSSWYRGRCRCTQYVEKEDELALPVCSVHRGALDAVPRVQGARRSEGDVVSEECPAGGEHCAHWFDGDRCCFCLLDGPTRVPDVVTVEIPGVSW